MFVGGSTALQNKCVLVFIVVGYTLGASQAIIKRVASFKRKNTTAWTGLAVTVLLSYCAFLHQQHGRTRHSKTAGIQFFYIAHNQSLFSMSCIFVCLHLVPCRLRLSVQRNSYFKFPCLNHSNFCMKLFTSHGEPTGILVDGCSFRSLLVEKENAAHSRTGRVKISLKDSRLKEQEAGRKLVCWMPVSKHTGTHESSALKRTDNFFSFLQKITENIVPGGVIAQNTKMKNHLCLCHGMS